MPLPWTTTIGQIRQIASEAVLGLAVGTNSARLNLAIRSALTEYHSAVRPDRTVNSSLLLGVGSGALSLAPVDYTAITDFTPERFLSAELQYTDGRRIQLESVDCATVFEALTNNSYLRIYPNLNTAGTGGYGSGAIGFDDDRTNLYIVPRVQTPTTIRLHYWKPLTAFDENTAAGTVVNVPDEQLHGCLYYGVPLFYESKTLEATRLNRLRDDFKAYLKHCKDIQKFGGNKTMYFNQEPSAGWRP
jgi:hypothetical protein